ncbi:MAG: hypothetical protein JNK85_10275 [Verrucomicrobiales bacterium]|nr:hypothetical protein [Verrucomicrobiales bacterium]
MTPISAPLTAATTGFWRRGGWVRAVAARILRVAVTLVALSLFYEWASPWAYPKDRKVDLTYGALHGAMMPMALPALLLGRDVPIFAEDHTGRWYKVGYIAGINLCGILVFGSAFLGKSKVATERGSGNKERPSGVPS